MKCIGSGDHIPRAKDSEMSICDVCGTVFIIARGENIPDHETPMTAYDVMTRFSIRPEAWAAMRRDTLEVLDITGEVVGLAVRGSTAEEDDDEFYYDVDWNQWFKVTYPGRSIVGSMAPVDGDTQDTFIWFIALD